ncbi:hypothetical protein SKC39_13110 [Mycolicibacterium sp. 120322]
MRYGIVAISAGASSTTSASGVADHAQFLEGKVDVGLPTVVHIHDDVAGIPIVAQCDSACIGQRVVGSNHTHEALDEQLLGAHLVGRLAAVEARGDYDQVVATLNNADPHGH